MLLRKSWKAGCCVILSIGILFLVSGCGSYKRDTSAGKIAYLTYEELEKKMEAKESFTVIFTQPTCIHCQEFKEVLDTYLPTHHVLLYDVSIDRDRMSDTAFKSLLANIRTYFPKMDGTPDLYYVKKGEVVERYEEAFDEKSFDEWVQEHQLDAA